MSDTGHNTREYMDRLDVRLLLIEPGSPWKNVYCESFNAKLRNEPLNCKILYTLQEAKILVGRWHFEYNTIRPHNSLRQGPPAPETRILIPTLAFTRGS